MSQTRRRMPRIAWFLAAGLACATGCADNSPPPPEVAVPRDASEGPLRRSDPVKPMPGQAPRADEFRAGDGRLPPPPFDDPALIDQEMPERRGFVAAYNAVGRPTLLIEGINQSNLFLGADRPAYLVFSDWMRCDGAVSVLAERGAVNPDVLIEFHVDGGGEDDNRGALNLTARAMNTADRMLLGQAMVDMPVPADRQAINRYTRFLARKLMSDMERAWSADLARPRAVEPPAPAPAPVPAPVPAPAPSAAPAPVPTTPATEPSR